jgi:hypothetical protein
MRIPHLIELWGVEQNRPLVLANGRIRGGFGKSGQKEVPFPCTPPECEARTPFTSSKYTTLDV